MSFSFVALTLNEANYIATHLESVAWPDDEVVLDLFSGERIAR
tara:strand:+ start:314 stop:442 length:129 start_codon:yes stop_codon:yes gene_type:complete